MKTQLHPYELKQRVNTLSAIIWMVLIASFALGLLNVQFRTWDSVIALFSLALICIPLLWLNTKGHFALAAMILSVIVLMVININIFDGDGIRDSGILAYPIFIMIGTLFFGKRAALYFTLAAVGSLIVLVYLEIHGYIHPTISTTGFSILMPIIILLLAAGTFIWVVVRLIENNLERVKESQDELTKNYDLTLAAWARVLEYRDKETEGHSRRLVELSTQLARAIGLSEEEIVQLRRGALLHDIGKLAIPDDILLKPGALNEEERRLLQQHPIYAKEMLTDVSFLQPCLDVAYSHHEHWDGHGYPEGLKGDGIPIKARIFTVVDQWDALSSDRPYRKAWHRDQVVAYFHENSGKIYDPHIVEVFLSLIQQEATSQ